MANQSLPLAFDVTPFIDTRTGIGRGVAELAEAIAEHPDRPRLIPYAFGTSLMRRDQGLPSGTRVLPIPTRALLWAWSRAERPRFDLFLRPARVIHATSFVAPPSRLPLLVTIHDCAFARLPEMVPPTVRRFGPVLRRAVARGAWVHTTTETVGAEAEELFGPGLRQSGRLIVVPFGVPRLRLGSRLPPSLATQLRGFPYVLALGRLEPRKNIPRLVQAFGGPAARHPDLRLVVAGPAGPGQAAVEEAVSSLEPEARRRVVITGAVSDGVVRSLLDGASVLAYPSYYEGFGFPMLEAMTVGVPVLAADAGALPEVAGRAAHLVDPFDTDSIGAGLELLLTDHTSRKELIGRGRVRASRYTWTKAADRLIAVYRDLAATAERISS
jgi:glycosyltransferase involved in cell wall biosynthesis